MSQNQPVCQSSAGKNHFRWLRISHQAVQASCGGFCYEMACAAQHVVDTPATFDRHRHCRTEHSRRVVLRRDIDCLAQIKPVADQFVDAPSLNRQSSSQIKRASTVRQLPNKQVHQRRSMRKAETKAGNTRKGARQSRQPDQPDNPAKMKEDTFPMRRSEQDP